MRVARNLEGALSLITLDSNKRIIKHNFTNNPHIEIPSQLSQEYCRVVNHYSEIKSGLDFILFHIAKPVLFPRTIMTNKLGYQKIFYSKEVFEHFLESEFVDCRINAYASLTEYKDIPRYKQDFLIIDLDKNNFKNNRRFENALYNTLKNIKQELDGYPTVLFTGGGYHIY